MLKKIITVVGIVALLSAVIVFSQGWRSQNAKQHTNPAATDPGQDIVVSSSSPSFKIILKSNPSTGYSWELDEYDQDWVEKISENYRPAVVKQGMVGAPGYEEWLFKAKSEFFAKFGTAEVTFVYKRSWEKEIAQKLTFKVVTENAN